MLKNLFVLYAEMAPYMASCLERLKEKTGCSIHGVAYPKAPNAPLELDSLSELGEWYSRPDLTEADILRKINEVGPDVVLSSGWMDKGYCRVLSQLQGKCLRVGGSDCQYRGDMRQQLACLGRTWLHKRWFDVLWVSGERQAYYARRLGFAGNRLWQGCYACERDRFAAAGIPHSQREPKFLYVGRFVESKGIDVLTEAYRNYRRSVAEPYPLECIGVGPLLSLLEEEPGVTLPGFVQPKELPDAMASAAAFILPSLHEPWGVVLQEAATLGLPLIATEACGAGVHLLRAGWNGFLVETGDAEALARAMVRMHNASEEEKRQMGEASELLSRQYTPDLWAKTLINGYREWKHENKEC